MFDESLSNYNMIVVETFNEKAYAFNIIKSGEDYYLQFDNMIKSIKKLIIKPDFWVFFEDGTYTSFRAILKSQKQESTLAKEYYIDPAIFKKLVSRGIITYTFGMADLYNFPRQYARDYEYHKSDYKRTKTKEKVLTKLRNGEFN